VPCCLRRTAARTDGHDDPLGFGNMWMCSPLTLVALTRGVVPIAKVHLLRNMVHLRCMHQPCRCQHVQPKKVDSMTCESSGCESRWYKNRKSSGWKYLPVTALTAMRTHAAFCTLPLPSTGGDTAIIIATHRMGSWSNQTSRRTPRFPRTPTAPTAVAGIWLTAHAKPSRESLRTDQLDEETVA
jgi:hypothetical protein